MGTGITDPHEALVHSQDSELNSAVLERRCLGGGVGGGIYKSRNSGGLGGTQLTPVDASVDRRQRRIRPVAVTQPIPPPNSGDIGQRLEMVLVVRIGGAPGTWWAEVRDAA